MREAYATELMTRLKPALIFYISLFSAASAFGNISQEDGFFSTKEMMQLRPWPRDTLGPNHVCYCIMLYMDVLYVHVSLWCLSSLLVC